MLPSQTVENYLKTIYLAQAGQSSPHELVPVGQLAAALRVVPGTATTMMKTLAESGLVRYEPYMGVRLTKAGEKLASLVLRRHRLIELFLVKVLGMSWAEVHDEAEHLEHAVSERLIDRIDEMLGRPEVDPHGDPIPTAEGRMPRPDYLDLLTAPLAVPLVITRVTDQDAGFLRFVEQHRLMPGCTVTVEGRETASDAVRLRSESGELVSIGARAAVRVLARLR
jgi:DtxR family Mn-dependent transcriptional regulator